MATRVVDYMTSKVATVHEEAKLGVAAEAFQAYPFHLPVLANSGDYVVGVVSDRDLLKACLEGRYDPEQRVGQVMAKDLALIDAQATLKDAAALLQQRGVNSLIVTGDAGRFLGLLTSRDLVRALAENLS